MTAMMSPEAWAQTEELAKRDGLGDAEMAGLAIGCPRHGNAWMDWDEDGVFCHKCENAQHPAELASVTVAMDRMHQEQSS